MLFRKFWAADRVLPFGKFCEAGPLFCCSRNFPRRGGFCRSGSFARGSGFCRSGGTVLEGAVPGKIPFRPMNAGQLSPTHLPDGRTNHSLDERRPTRRLNEDVLFEKSASPSCLLGGACILFTETYSIFGAGRLAKSPNAPPFSVFPDISGKKGKLLCADRHSLK